MNTNYIHSIEKIIEEAKESIINHIQKNGAECADGGHILNVENDSIFVLLHVDGSEYKECIVTDIIALDNQIVVVVGDDFVHSSSYDENAVIINILMGLE